ncbi:hypothetical protein ACE5IS_11700 [Leptospira wolffii]|uniref:Uncharacterized protein n=1 Tax=Leptospira wolffii TaxID=409998 RepID=A0ABV5BNY4_9LEPT|nr:hypothetical protein [Leptospira wolffii]EPG65815.1 hypothetical protein LEP1GSC061_2300 [Leptospira wolffii serovar Khorat str. Khorat-H2]
MQILVRFLIAVLLLFFVTLLYSAEVPKYSEMEKHLLPTWNKSFPVPFAKVLHRDLSGKGVLLYRKSSKKSVYIYHYSVFLPYYAEEGEKPVRKEGGREIKVKLLYDPSSSSERYSIELGEMDEAYDTKGIIRWIR